MTSPVACPHCGSILDPPPARTRKCPDCSQKIVRRRSGDVVRWLTEEDAQAYDEEWKAKVSLNQTMARLETMGLSPSDYERTSSHLAAEWRFTPTPHDVFSTLANQHIQKLLASGDLRAYAGDLSTAYRMLALQAWDDGTSPSHRRILQRESHRFSILGDLANIRAAGIDPAKWFVRTLAQPGDCPACLELSRLTFSLDKAPSSLVLPPEGCTCEWCRCAVVTIPSFDLG